MHALTILAQQGGGADGAVGILGALCVAVFGLLGFVVWLWALIDAIRNPALDANMRLIWVLVIVLLSLLGAILYLVLGRSTRGPGGPPV